MYGNVLKIQVWIPHENIGNPYFFVFFFFRFFSRFRVIALLIKMKSRIFVLLLPSWASSVGDNQC